MKAGCPRFAPFSGANLGFQSHPVGRKNLAHPFKAGKARSIARESRQGRGTLTRRLQPERPKY